MIKKIVSLAIIISFLWQFNLSFAENIETSKLNISPIIQLVSYNSKFGKYPEMNWWWSASIINNNWIIISNNHVVDNWNWWISDFFSVCITEKNWEKPNCKYTASLINRDKDMDISILKINSKDIDWNTINYNNFKFIDIDYNYSPKTQDEVFAVGYPWIWAESITETKWIVSWISNYNNFDYIKTDATIAWWNSWWALIKDNKLIWIPTFKYWGMSDSSLWYALSIKDAKKFIEENISKTPEISQNLFDFWKYKSSLDTTNSNKFLKDLFFDVKLNSDFEIKSYVENKYLEIWLNKMKNKVISWWKISLLKIPPFIKNWFKTFLEAEWFYNSNNFNLEEITISNQKFFYPKYKNNLWNDTPFVYFWQIWANFMIILELEKWNSEEINNYTKEFEEFTQMLNFDSTNLEKINFEFKLEKPKIEIIAPQSSYIDNINWEIISYTKELWIRLSIWIERLEDWNWKNKDINEIYNITTKDIQEEYKSKINLKWYNWFIYCTEDKSAQNTSFFEEKNNSPRIICNYNIYWLENNEYYLTIQLNSKEQDITKNIDYINKYLEKWIKLPETWNNETKLINIFKNQIVLKFGDLGNQSTNYKNKLKLLVKYNLLQNREKFEPYKPLTWEEFIWIYVRYVYDFQIDRNSEDCKDYVCKFKKYNLEIDWKNTNLYNILSEMKIPFKNYVQSNKTNDFYSIFQLKIAWVKTDNITREDISNIIKDVESPIYQEIRTKLKDFNNSFFWEKSIKIWDLIGKNYNFNSNKIILSDSNNNIYTEEKDIIINFWNSKETNKYTDYEKCLNTKNFKDFINCSKKYNEKYNISKIEILTKSKAIDEFVELMDFSLFDENLIAK